MSVTIAVRRGMRNQVEESVAQQPAGANCQKYLEEGRVLGCVRLKGKVLKLDKNHQISISTSVYQTYLNGNEGQDKAWERTDQKGGSNRVNPESNFGVVHEGEQSKKINLS
jgi:hypothetical protein